MKIDLINPSDDQVNGQGGSGTAGQGNNEKWEENQWLAQAKGHGLEGGRITEDVCD